MYKRPHFLQHLQTLLMWMKTLIPVNHFGVKTDWIHISLFSFWWWDVGKDYSFKGCTAGLQVMTFSHHTYYQLSQTAIPLSLSPTRTSCCHGGYTVISVHGQFPHPTIKFKHPTFITFPWWKCLSASSGCSSLTVSATNSSRDIQSSTDSLLQSDSQKLSINYSNILNTNWHVRIRLKRKHSDWYCRKIKVNTCFELINFSSVL